MIVAPPISPQHISEDKEVGHGRGKDQCAPVEESRQGGDMEMEDATIVGSEAQDEPRADGDIE